MATQEDRDLNLFRRLHVSLADIRSARFCAGVLLKNGWHHTPWERGGTIYDRQSAFTTALVVSYGRPFTTSKGWPQFPDRLLDAYEAGDKVLHRQLLDLRGTVYAHSDSTSYDIRPSPKHYTIQHFPSMMITASDCKQFQRMTLALIKRIRERYDELSETYGWRQFGIKRGAR